MTLKENGVSYLQLGIISLSSTAAYLKIIFGPITDVYYIERIGKRLTYMLFCGILLSAFSLYISYNIKTWLNEIDTVSIGIMTFIMAMVVWLQDVVIDS